MILKICRMFSYDEAGQKDLYQDICINIWKGLPGFKGRSQLSTWMYRVALNTALSQGKKHHRNPLYQAEMVEDKLMIRYLKTRKKRSSRLCMPGYLCYVD